MNHPFTYKQAATIVKGLFRSPEMAQQIIDSIGGQRQPLPAASATNEQEGPVASAGAAQTTLPVVSAEDLSVLQSILQAKSSEAYLKALNQFKQTDCLGWESKVATNNFGVNQMTAHASANVLMGEHRAYADAAKELHELRSKTSPEPVEDGWEYGDALFANKSEWSKLGTQWCDPQLQRWFDLEDNEFPFVEGSALRRRKVPAAEKPAGGESIEQYEIRRLREELEVASKICDERLLSIRAMDMKLTSAASTITELERRVELAQLDREINESHWSQRNDHSREELSTFTAKNAELEEWKRQQLFVTGQLDNQSIATLLDCPLGGSTYEWINKRVPEVLKERDEANCALAEARKEVQGKQEMLDVAIEEGNKSSTIIYEMCKYLDPRPGEKNVDCARRVSDELTQLRSRSGPLTAEQVEGIIDGVTGGTMAPAITATITRRLNDLLLPTWRPISDKPTEKDADRNGNVEWLYESGSVVTFGWNDMEAWPEGVLERPIYWRPTNLPPPPPAAPVEDEFEKWWHGNSVDYPNVEPSQAKDIWIAAKLNKSQP